MMHEIIKFIRLVPLIGFLVVGLFGKYLKSEKLIGSIASGAVGISFILSVLLLFQLINHPIEKPINCTCL